MDIEIFARSILEQEFGYRVTKIPESSAKSPDFLVEGDKRFLIEFKSREDDDAALVKFRERLETSGSAEFFDATGRKNTVSGIVHDASNQLKAISVDVDFRLVWLMGIGRNQRMKMDQFKSSLYGLCTIFDLDSPHTFPCYYFGFNDFYRHQDVLDGAIVSTMEEAQLCLNTHSKRYKALKLSSLASKLAVGLCDPLCEEALGKAMLLEDDIDRRKTNECIRALNRKYGKSKLQNMQIEFMSHTLLVPGAPGA